jgi:hypothetical protein
LPDQAIKKMITEKEATARRDVGAKVAITQLKEELELRHRYPIYNLKKLTSVDIALMRRRFALIDTNGNGRIETLELKRAYSTLQIPISTTTATKIIGEIDFDNSGAISFKDFVRALVDLRMGRTTTILAHMYDQSAGFALLHALKKLGPKGALLLAAMDRAEQARIMASAVPSLRPDVCIAALGKFHGHVHKAIVYARQHADALENKVAHSSTAHSIV